MNRVEAEEVLERLGLGDVDDRPDLDVLAAMEQTEDVAADAAESHDADANCHGSPRAARRARRVSESL